ncbi:circadian clock protein KaiC [Massilia aurea]|uniref:Circadian clock protein KaiC n=1 Tax=Massilia aurea TaxID=373040 RepID=A0A7W9U6U5_9BURK|nr:ATPase domain-containing protein [Massilia aurea]MBB6132665.1 circadian clock protein KaiC [Massilia aurea]
MKKTVQRLLTGVPELDAVMYGGLSKGRIHLVEGKPGTGKTTLGLRFLIEGVKNGETCLYLSLSEGEDELRESADNHGWDLHGIDIAEMIPVPDEVDAQTILLPTETDLASLVEQISERIKLTNSARVVIDSMAEVRLLAHDSAHYRRQIISLRKNLMGLGSTVLMLDDITSDGQEYELESAVHGVIGLELQERSFGAARRRLHVVKLRSGPFQSGWHDYAIVTGEILVFPSLIAQEHHRTSAPIEIYSGVSSFDELIGGPLTTGSSTMILGPSGVGKTTLALQYALTAVRAGHKVVHFNFDESETTLRSRLVADMGEAQVTGDGTVNGNSSYETKAQNFILRRINPSRISPGELIWNVRRMVEDEDVKLVIIDSINSYLDIIPEEKSLLPQMNELFSYMSNMNVMAIIIGAHSSQLDTSKQPDAVSIITDNIISMRYYERDNVVNKAISVLKKRQGKHAHDIRQLELTEEGIQLGPRVSGIDSIPIAGSLGN